MSKFLIHIHSGPDLKNKATLGMLVAVTAFNKGNEVNIFLAADGVHLLNVKKEGEVVGQGTGDLKSHLDVLKKNKVKLYVSGMSAKARGYDDSLLDDSNKIRSSTGINAEWSSPLGPMSFVFSKNITKASTDVTEGFNFNLGTTF